MKDFKGNELNVGDKVIFVKHNSMYEGKILKIMPKQCRTSCLLNNGTYSGNYLIQFPHFETLKVA